LTQNAIIVVAGEVSAVSSFYFNNPRTKFGELPSAQWGGDSVLK
jgi:hypothetical protein